MLCCAVICIYVYIYVDISCYNMLCCVISDCTMSRNVILFFTYHVIIVLSCIGNVVFFLFEPRKAP